MPVTFHQVVELVLADNNANGRTEISKADVESIARKTIESIGMGVAENGEVYSPAPVVNPFDEQNNRQQNVHWPGGRNRRHRR